MTPHPPIRVTDSRVCPGSSSRRWASIASPHLWQTCNIRAPNIAPALELCYLRMHEEAGPSAFLRYHAPVRAGTPRAPLKTPRPHSSFPRRSNWSPEGVLPGIPRCDGWHHDRRGAPSLLFRFTRTATTRRELLGPIVLPKQGGSVSVGKPRWRWAQCMATFAREPGERSHACSVT